MWNYGIKSIRGENAQTLKGVLCGSPVFLIPKSNSSISRLTWGVIAQGFIRIVRLALEIPNLGTLGILPPSFMQLEAKLCG